MEYRELGKSGIKISAIGIGTWQWGSREWGWNRLYTKVDLETAFQKSLELGINLVDTAEIYGFGRSETMLGEMIHGHREEVFIATKVWTSNLSYGRVLRAAERSLQRLKVDVIDLLQIHWPNPVIPIKNTMKAMKKLVQQGKVRYVGVSNFNSKKMLAAQEALAPLDLVSNQVEYNIIDRRKVNELLPTASQENVTIIAYSPLAKGLLTGKYTADSKPSSFVQKASSRFSQTNLKKLAEFQQTIKRIGDAHQRTPTQVALNWLISQQNVVAIPGVKRPSNVTDNAGAADWRLTASEISALTEAAELIHFNRMSGLPNLIRALIPV